MDFNWFNKELERKVNAIKQAISRDITQKVEAAALRFVDDNFRNQGWEGQAWPKIERDGTILVKSGDLRRGFYSEKYNGNIHIKNEIPYAKAHNEGFEGKVSIKAHKRGKFQKMGAKKKKLSTMEVRAHARMMRFKKRQYAPYPGSESRTLNSSINIIIDKHIHDILKP